jgi:serine/threonine protein kinase/tetratricopeptide (TPR) repeat protein
MPLDPRRVETIFNAALAVPSADRPGLIATACDGDAGLRARVEQLLAAHEELGEPGASATGDCVAPVADAPGSPGTATGKVGEPLATDDHSPRPDVGTVIAGKYKLIEQVGEGGMGTVWMAQQTEPVKRFVAVKLIKAGMDSRAVLARFEAERQALALMDHPNIAKVLDAGATPDGRPFFVMELVKGVPITKFCDEKKLTPRERLELFVPVCQAIQHAHQKGVIHRDIKPSNVLIALYDDRPVPKVIDFGVAKATGQQLTDKTLATGFGAIVGTPEYMSPEQASFNNLDIDTRSDVYALGVLLYELLAGSPPFSRTELEKVGLLEIFRVVREVEPPRPSTKLSTAGALPALSANRGTEPKRLTAILRGELDWIVMKALEKDRTRRYETANGFAADVQRYLAGEPVLAVPPSAGYRARKFLRKNRVAVLAGALVFLALLAGIVGTTWGLIEARRQRDAAEVARHNEETERKAAVAERDAKEKARAAERAARKAEERQRLATAGVLQFFTERVIAVAQPRRDGGMGRDVTVLAALRAAERQIEQAFAAQPEIEAKLRMSLGETFAALGVFEPAEKQFKRAAEVYATLPDQLDARRDARYASVWIRIERQGERQRPETLAQLMGAKGPREIEAALTEWVAESRRGEPDYFQARTLAALGQLRFEQGRFREAEADFRECFELLDRIDREHWLPWYARVASGACLARQNKYPEAEPLLLAGYRGMKEREPEIPSQDQTLLPEAADRLVELYTAWGKPDEVAKWRTERTKYPFIVPPPREVKR